MCDLVTAQELPSQVQFKIPNDPDLHYIKGVILRAQGKWDESILAYEEAMRLDPLNALIFDQLCYTYNILHRYKDVIELTIKGKSLIPEYTGFKSEIFDAEINLCEDIQKAIETSGLTEEELGGNAQYLRLNKKYSAMRLLIRKRGVLAGMVNDYRSTIEIARVYFWKGNRPMAKVYADSAISFFIKSFRK